MTEGTRPPLRRLVELAILALAVGMLGAVVANQLLSAPDTSEAAGTAPDGRVIHVDDGAPAGGDGSPGAPYRSIQRGLVDARPGDEVRVADGTYEETVRSVRAGLPDAPIRLVGETGARIVGDGSEPDHLVTLAHDDLELTGFTLAEADNLVWLRGVTRVRVLDNTLQDAAGECIRVQLGSSGNEIAHNTIRRCGLEGFDLDEDHKNGEGVYIGTAPEQLEEFTGGRPDRSNGNWVHDNRISVPAECVDIKEDAVGNVVEGNHCESSKDPDGAGFSSRGLSTVFRENVSTGHAGDGIRLGGDETDDGLRTDVRGNRLTDNRGYAVSVQRTPQFLICGNEVGENGKGRTDGERDPAAPCGGE